MALVKRTAHVLTLGFTAFWLVATSRAPGPVHPCFVPLEAKKVRIALGAAMPASPGAAPSCQGLDDLREGAVIGVGLIPSSDRTARVRVDQDDACLGYDVTELTGPVGLSQPHSGDPRYPVPRALFESRAHFSSASSAPRCAGEYHISVAPVNPLPRNALVDPLDAGHREPWQLRRVIRVDTTRVCALSPALPPGDCQDIFEVRSLELGP
ncbi:MAG TPA: hypothetical protein VFQ61_00050 [Polyangiaceae bacterium]|nr:hypothetical protein [Polyangiaceae bacterium]